MYAGLPYITLSISGNARPMIVFDTVRRYFEYKGYDVNYVSNFTDVDDKIIKKAIEEGVTADEISKRYIAECKKTYGWYEHQAGNQEPSGNGRNLRYGRYDPDTD